MWLSLVIVAGGVVGLFISVRLRSNHEKVLAAASSALESGDYAQALETALVILEDQPDSIDALLIGGHSSAGLGDADGAVAFFDRLPAGTDSRVNDAHAFAANIVLFELGMASDSEHRMRAILDRDPQHLPALSGLGSLLGLAGRRQEAVPIYLELILRDRIQPEQLSLLGAESGAHKNAALLKRCQEAVPNDPIPLMGLAWQAANEFHFEEAERLVRATLDVRPDLLEASVLLGRILVTQRRFGEFTDWDTGLPAGADEHSEIWRIRGDVERETNGESAAAARCYWESVRRNPNIRATLYAIVDVLQTMEENERAEPFASRLQKVQELLDLQAIMFDSAEPDVGQVRRVTEQMEELGRVWESYAWSRVALRHAPETIWARERCRRLRTQLALDLPLTLAEANPALAVDLSHFPLPAVRPSNLSDLPRTVIGRSDSEVRFHNAAAELGLKFQYFNGGTAEGYQYEFSGGGVAVLDYDLDGWPDLYLTQGCRWPPDASLNGHLDALFRNKSGRSVRSSAALAGIFESGFSQGAAVGDFNQDGFPDLYVGNIGPNQLFRNNGDGTFTAVAADGRHDTGQWTVSCLLADVSGDGLPDLYDVNYLSDGDVFERVCQRDDGVPYQCPPFQFRGAQDQYHVNSGAGTFENQTESSGFQAPGGKGLGLVAADFDGTGTLSLFVANDATANFFFQHNGSQETSQPVVSETGVLSGLAYGDQGQVQSCMGVAAGDMNGDGLIDLFVTNFAREYDALYLQSAAGLFPDEIRRSGIAEATLPVLGFGTQAIDGDLDGHLDLVVANGHIQDERKYTGDGYKMPPQYFRNLGDARFEIVDGGTIGPYFEGQYLGRGLARLDFDRDGREDFAVSHLDSPAALLLNRTQPVGHALVVRLIGVRSNREAIGATVVVESGGRSIVRHMTAGDGYQASNQRTLVFGLAENPHVDRIEIRWPSGIVQEFTDISADGELLIVESRSRPLKNPRPGQ